MSTARTDFPVTADWTSTDYWGGQIDAIDTTYGVTVNEQQFEVTAAESDGYAMNIRMSVKKQVVASETRYWWGYASQVNFTTDLAAQGVL